MRVDFLERPTGRRKLCVNIQNFPQLLDGILILARHVELPSQRRIDDEREWIQFLGLLRLHHSFFEAAHVGQIVAVPVMRRRQIRIQFDGPLELLLGSRPIPFKMFFHQAQGGMRFREAIVYVQRLHGGSFCLGPGLRWRQISSVPQKAVSVGQARVRERVMLVPLHCLGEKIRGFLEIRLRPFIPIEETLQVELVGLGILGRTLGQQFPLFACQSRAQAPVNVSGNLLLHGYQIRKLAIVLLTPDLPVIRHVFQIHADGQVVAGLDEPAGENGPHVQVAPYLLRV